MLIVYEHGLHPFGTNQPTMVWYDDCIWIWIAPIWDQLTHNDMIWWLYMNMDCALFGPIYPQWYMMITYEYWLYPFGTNLPTMIWYDECRWLWIAPIWNQFTHNDMIWWLNMNMTWIWKWLIVIISGEKCCQKFSGCKMTHRHSHHIRPKYIEKNGARGLREKSAVIFLIPKNMESDT